jgi:ferrous iron transport protein A
MSQAIPLGKLKLGSHGIVKAVKAPLAAAEGAHQLEYRLLEMGVVEGAPLSLVHEGPFGRDPIIVQVQGALIAMGRREADAVLVDLDS